MQWVERVSLCLVFSLFLTAPADGAEDVLVDETALASSLQAERTHLLKGSKTRVGMVLSLTAPKADPSTQESGVAISLVVDRSGSMSGPNKIGMVHQAGAKLVEQIVKGDTLSVVTYSDETQVVRPMGEILDKDGVKQLIRAIDTRGGTNLGGGLQEGVAQVPDQKERVKRLLLLTDGLANQGETRPEILKRWAKDAFIKGLRISTVGLGTDYNEELLGQIAHAGGGEFHYIEKPDQLPALFHTELKEGRAVMIRDLTITVQTQQGAIFNEVVGYPATGGTPAAREIKIGDFFSKEHRELVLDLELAPPAHLTKPQWLPITLTLHWRTNHDEKRMASLKSELFVTQSESAVAGSAVPAVQARVIEAQNYKSLDKAMDLYQEGKQKEALEMLKTAEALTQAVRGDKRLVDQAAQLAQTRQEIEQGANRRDTQVYGKAGGKFGYRYGGGRLVGKQVGRAGGGVRSTSSVNSGLLWLARHQEADGGWQPANLGGRAEEQQRCSAFSALALLGAGNSTRYGNFREALKKSIGWFVARQQPDGFIGAPSQPDTAIKRWRMLIDHAIATEVLVESYAMGGNEQQAARKAIDWLVTQKPFALAKTLDGHKDLSDTDVAGLGWILLPLRSARIARLPVPEETLDQAKIFLTGSSNRDNSMTQFRFWKRPPSAHDTMIGNFAWFCVGAKRDQVLPGTTWALSQPTGMPAWGKDGVSVDWSYLYFCNVVCFQLGIKGGTWQRWNPALKSVLIDKQIQTDGVDRMQGAWPAVGTWKDRSPIGPTALASLCMEVYYRYMQVAK